MDTILFLTLGVLTVLCIISSFFLNQSYRKRNQLLSELHDVLYELNEVKEKLNTERKKYQLEKEERTNIITGQTETIKTYEDLVKTLRQSETSLLETQSRHVDLLRKLRTSPLSYLSITTEGGKVNPPVKLKRNEEEGTYEILFYSYSDRLREVELDITKTLKTEKENE